MTSHACVIQWMGLCINRRYPCLIMIVSSCCSTRLLCTAAATWIVSRRVRSLTKVSFSILRLRILSDRQPRIHFHLPCLKARFLCLNKHSSLKILQFHLDEFCSEVDPTFTPRYLQFPQLLLKPSPIWAAFHPQSRVERLNQWCLEEDLCLLLFQITSYHF